MRRRRFSALTRPSRTRMAGRDCYDECQRGVHVDGIVQQGNRHCHSEVTVTATQR